MLYVISVSSYVFVSKDHSDGLVERFNRTIEDKLSKAVSDLYYAIQLSKPKMVHHDRLKAYLREPKT